jgi:hypothetical protein
MWKRWIVGAPHESETEHHSTSPSVERPGIHTTLHALPTLLNSSSLPNGVIELLIDDFEEPTRQLFDINDGHITLVDPGTAIPWASIAGSASAWAEALGPERNVSALRLTGDEQLALRVLAALPPHDS